MKVVGFNGSPRKKGNTACSIEDDPVNEWIQKIKEADGLLLGSPVHFSGVAQTYNGILPHPQD